MPLDAHTRSLETCTYCPKLCRDACPVSNGSGREALIPQAKMQLLNMLRRNALGWTEELTEPLFGCTGCGLCTVYCEHKVDVAAALWEGRQQAQARNLGPRSLERLAQTMRGETEALRLKLERSAWGPKVASEARVAYLPAFDTLDRYRNDLSDFFYVCSQIGLDYVRIADTPLCASYHLLAAGLNDAAQLAAEEMIRHIRRYATIVTGSPACVHLLRVTLPAQGLHHNTEVLHITEFLATHAERIEPLRRRPAVFYHDPCHLGRRLGAYDEPRRLVARCADTMREFQHNREYSQCCGGGGLVAETFPDAAVNQATRRLDEARLFNVHVVVTGCPVCKRTFEATRSGVEILDVVNLLAWSLRPAERLTEHVG